jgi:hypothetical protein
MFVQPCVLVDDTVYFFSSVANLVISLVIRFDVNDILFSNREGSTMSAYPRTICSSSGIWSFFRLGFLPAAYTLMLLIMFILPFFSVDEYSILKNTTSHLGAQGAPYAWVMNVVFALLGTSAIVDGWVRLSNFWLHKIVLVVFGISLFLTAFFQHAPIVPNVDFNVLEDDLHSIFATITGFSFVFFTISAVFIESARRRRIIAACIGIIAILLSILIFNVAELAGVWQRLMFITMFAWLMSFLYSRKNDAIHHAEFT